MREGFTAASRPGPRLVEGLSEGAGPLQDTVRSLFPGPPVHPLAQGWVSWRASGRRPESASNLSLRLMTATPLTLD